MEFIGQYWIYFVGFIGQSLFGIRVLIQWVHSEQEGKIVSPVRYWQVSLLASFIILIYGILRTDGIIIFGQLLSYYIYIRNLQLKNNWLTILKPLRILLFALPVTILLALFFVATDTSTRIFEKIDLSSPTILLGAIGQLMLNLRFVYQWYYSEKRKVSMLPIGFWVISFMASLLVLSYGFYRRDPVILVSQSLGIIAYVRNIRLYFRSSRQTQPPTTHP